MLKQSFLPDHVERSTMTQNTARRTTTNGRKRVLRVVAVDLALRVFLLI